MRSLYGRCRVRLWLSACWLRRFGIVEREARGCGMAKAKTSPRWRKLVREGEPCLVSPEGHVFYGTAQEVRLAALPPDSRARLADELRAWRCAYRGRPADEVRARVRALRRAAIRAGALDMRLDWGYVPIAPRERLLLKAGARLAGFASFEDYFRDIVRIEIESLLDLAETETGKREIPLTRHERAALERIEREAAHRGAM